MRLIPLLALWLFLTCQSALAAPGRVLNIIVGEWPPFVSEQSKQHGPVAHLISDLFKEAGYQVKFHFAPWGRVYSLAANSQLYDATAVWMHKTEREQDFLFSEAVLQEQFVFFSLKSRQLQAERLSRSSACGWGAISPTATGPSWTRWWPMAG
ncbi:hypothetical protein [Aeromonas veronii]|uniref:hypothetical protein n=1 Tax=Aeromonas veronii TaxID=654 RepID=UPI000A766775|nr:hypothetical protein [Aeromonas veronii]